MSNLTIYPEHQPDNIMLASDDATIISEQLRTIGVCFERWQTQEVLPKGADDKAVMDAYAGDIECLMTNNGYQSVDVVRLTADHPQKIELRQKFLSEHTHSEDEVRFFVEGSGMFYLHAEGNVYMVLCERGDLISVPKGARHWFDMGENPDFTCIRLFTSKDGWAAEYTGDDIASNFPKFEEKAA